MLLAQMPNATDLKNFFGQVQNGRLRAGSIWAFVWRGSLVFSKLVGAAGGLLAMLRLHKSMTATEQVATGGGDG